MSLRKDPLRCRAALVAASLAVALSLADRAGALPTPDPVARVPLVGLLPRWTWDPSARSAPAQAGVTSAPDPGVETAEQFVVVLLEGQGESVDSIAAYRLDDPTLVSVLAGLTPKDHDGLRTTTFLAFTVRLTALGDGTYAAQLVVEDR